jgi:hypothetical protein
MYAVKSRIASRILNWTVVVVFFVIAVTVFIHTIKRANAAEVTPTGTFKAYHDAILHAHRLSDLDPYLPKRYIENRSQIINAIAKNGVERGEIERAMLSTMQSQIGKIDIIVVNESPSSRGTSAEGKTQAYVKMEGVNRETHAPAYLTAVMELEDGRWKYAGNVDSTPADTEPISTPAAR